MRATQLSEPTNLPAHGRRDHRGALWFFLVLWTAARRTLLPPRPHRPRAELNRAPYLGDE
jgi:hypothetical protein